MELSEQEAHCVARLLQASLYGGDDKNFGCPLDGCQYCKVQCYKQGENSSIFSHLRKRFTEETGVDISTEIYGTFSFCETVDEFPQTFREVVIAFDIAGFHRKFHCVYVVPNVNPVFNFAQCPAVIGYKAAAEDDIRFGL